MSDINDNTNISPGVGGDLEHENATNQPPMTPEELGKQFWKGVSKLGADSGDGSNALPRLGLAVIRAASDGILSIEKRNGKDDATLIYDAYAAADSKKAEHTAGGAKANASKLRQLIQAGLMTTCDFVAVADEVVLTRRKLEGDDVKVKALYPALVDAARAQLETDTDLTSDMVDDLVRVTPKEKTLEGEIKALHKRVEKLVKGDANGLKDDSPEMKQIEEILSAKVTKFGKVKLDEEFIKLAMSRGFTQAQAEELAAKQ